MMEVKVYGVHVTQENKMSDVMNDRFVQMVKKHGAAFVMDCKDPVRYLASFVLPTRKKQAEFWAELKAMGINAETDSSPSFMPEEYLGKYIGKDWMKGK